VAIAVAVIHHDQQGVVLADQAAAQSTDAGLRDRARRRADAYRRHHAAVAAVLDRAGVPPGDRLSGGDRVARSRRAELGCDLMPGDAVSRLAALAPDAFDARYRRLMRRHRAAGRALEHRLVGSELLTGADRATLATLERGL
jgi:hypothetical protein